MKNNILLILAVTIISIGIIVATVLISSAGNNNSSESDKPSLPDTSRSTSATEPPTDEAPSVTTPSTTTTQSEATSIPDETSGGNSQPYDSEAAEGIIATAHALIGIDFADDGASPDYGFDNSGFIYYVLRENGYITCPRGLNAQSQMGTALTYEELRPGDLAFFYAEDMTSIGFGGIYCGDGIMLACLMPGTQVKEVDITTTYYRNHFFKGVSLT